MFAIEHPVTRTSLTAHSIRCVDQLCSAKLTDSEVGKHQSSYLSRHTNFHHADY